jgi:hypothetical protein
MMQVLPEKKSPITHAVGSDLHTGGLQATIFYDNPEDSDDTLMENEPTVYLSATKKGEFFQPFATSKHTALIMPLGIYLSLLQFMQQEWKNVETLLDKKIKVMKNVSFPKMCQKNISFLSHGTVVYERWFNLLFFHYKKSSQEEISKCVHLQIQNVSIEVELDVLYTLSLQFDSLLEILTRIGYKYPGPVGLYLQLNHGC